MKKRIPWILLAGTLALGIFVAIRSNSPASPPQQTLPIEKPPYVDRTDPVPAKHPVTLDSSPKNGRLVISAKTPDQRPLANVRLYCNFMVENPSPDPAVRTKTPVMNEILKIEKGFGFLGDPFTDKDGSATLEVSIPPGAAYMASVINILPELRGAVVQQSDSVTIPLVKPGETRSVQIVLQLGTPIRGIVRGLDPGDETDLLLKIAPVPSQSPKETPKASPASGPEGWYALPKVRPDGTFESEPAPLVPLQISLKHYSEKFKPLQQEILPPFGVRVELVPQRSAGFSERGIVNFRVSNPPQSRFQHTLVIFSEETKSTQSLGTWSTADPQTVKLQPGSYQAFLLSVDEPLWAHAFFESRVGLTTDVTLNLEKACRLTLKFRERSTGNPPKIKRARFTVAYQISGTYYDLFNPYQVGLEGRIAEKGEAVFGNMPAGQLQLSLRDLDDSLYEPVTLTFVADAGSNPVMDVLLERAKDERDP